MFINKLNVGFLSFTTLFHERLFFSVNPLDGAGRGVRIHAGRCSQAETMRPGSLEGHAQRLQGV